MRIVVLAVCIALVFGSAARAAVPSGFVGVVADDAFIGTDAYQREQLAQMRAAGVTLVRRTLDWAEIERAPGVYDWSAYDRFVLAAAAQGIEVLPILFDPPDFLAAPRPKSYAPKLPRDFFDVAIFARAAIARFGPQGTLWAEHPDAPARPIRAWQVWNEPNLAAYWPLLHSARDYTRLLSVVAPAIHEADPGAEVVAAGLPDSRRASTWAIPLDDYIDDLLHEGAGRWIDSLAVNAYAPTADGVVAIARRARRALNRRGLRDVRLRITEVGWSTGGPAGAYSTTMRGQAQRIRALLPKLARARASLKLEGVVYYAWRDARPYAGGKDFWGLHTGLLDLAGRPKPGLGAFRDAALALSAPAR